MVKIEPLLGSQHMSWSKIINQLSRTRFEVSFTPPLMTSHVYYSEAVPPLEGTLTPVQESRHGSNSFHRSRWIPQIVKQLSALIPLHGQDYVTIVQLIKQLEIIWITLYCVNPTYQDSTQMVTKISKFKPISWDPYIFASAPPPLSDINTPPSPRRRSKFDWVLTCTENVV